MTHTIGPMLGGNDVAGKYSTDRDEDIHSFWVEDQDRGRETRVIKSRHDYGTAGMEATTADDMLYIKEKGLWSYIYVCVFNA